VPALIVNPGVLALLNSSAEAGAALIAARSVAAAAAAKSFFFMDMVAILGSSLGLRAGQWG
jgi:hypothetical protein